MCNKIKHMIIILSAFVVILLGIYKTPILGTISFLVDQADTVENTFMVADVDCIVDEKFSNNVKSDVRVQNSPTSDASVYIRVKLLFNWKDRFDSDKIIAKDVWSPQNTTIPCNESWVKGDDGYFYYTVPVAPGQYTECLIDTIKLEGNSSDGTSQSLEIIASCVQAFPKEAVLESWKIVKNVKDGSLELYSNGSTQ